MYTVSHREMNGLFRKHLKLHVCSTTFSQQHFDVNVIYFGYKPHMFSGNVLTWICIFADVCRNEGRSKDWGKFIGRLKLNTKLCINRSGVDTLKGTVKTDGNRSQQAYTCIYTYIPCFDRTPYIAHNIS